jgi:hypothetical protein
MHHVSITSEGGADLIQWVQGSSFASSMHKMIDPDLGNNYNSSEFKKLLAVAKLCIKSGDKTNILYSTDTSLCPEEVRCFR